MIPKYEVILKGGEKISVNADKYVYNEDSITFLTEKEKITDFFITNNIAGVRILYYIDENGEIQYF